MLRNGINLKKIRIRIQVPRPPELLDIQGTGEEQRLQAKSTTVCVD